MYLILLTFLVGIDTKVCIEFLMSLFFVYGLSEDGVLVYYVHRLLLFWFVCHFDWPAPVVLWEVVTMEIVRINKIDNFAPQRSRSIDKAGYSMHARSIIQPGKFSTSWKRKCEFKAKTGENKENKNLSFGARILLLRLPESTVVQDFKNQNLSSADTLFSSSIINNNYCQHNRFGRLFQNMAISTAT